VNIKKTRWIFNELGLQLRHRHPKRRVKAELPENCEEEARPNHVSALDFVHDQLAMGKKLRILTIVDTHPRFSCRGEDVVQTLEKICATGRDRKTIRILSRRYSARTAGQRKTAARSPGKIRTYGPAPTMSRSPSRGRVTTIDPQFRVLANADESLPASTRILSAILSAKSAIAPAPVPPIETIG